MASAVARNLAPLIPAAFVGRDGRLLTQDQIEREREISQALMSQGDPAFQDAGWLGVIGRGLEGAVSGWKETRANRAERENASFNADIVQSLLGSIGGSTALTPSGTSPVPTTSPTASSEPMDYASARVASAHGDPVAWRNAIASIESAGSGDYAAVGPTHPKLGRALGRYQVMEANVGPWTEKYLGRRLTPEEFLASPEAQDAVFDGEFGSYVQRFGDPALAAQAWFAGPGGVGTNRQDSLGTSVPEYARRFQAVLNESPQGTQQALESLPVGGSMTMPDAQPAPAPIQVAQAGGGINPAIIEALSNPRADEGTRRIAALLLEQQIQAQQPQQLINAGGGNLYDPNSGQWIQAPRQEGEIGGPAAFQTLHMRALAAGLQEGTPEYQAFMAQGGGSSEDSAANQRIERMTENLMATGDFVDPLDARNIAVGIVDGRLRADRHPITGVLQVVDMATGRPAYEHRNQQPSAGDAMLTPEQTAPANEFGQQYPNAPGSFGVGGAAQSAINRATDALGMGPAYPDVAQTQADFAVLRESLLNDIASSYGRQPPSWLLKEIRDLTPEAGSVFQGAGTAQSKLRSLGRHLSAELDNTNRALERDLSPSNRQEMEARQQGLIAGLERVNGALRSFEPQQTQEGRGDIPPPPQGIDPTDWQYMTPEERALFQ